LFATMPMYPLLSPGTMVIDAMGMVCFILPSRPAVASVPNVAPVAIAAPVPAPVPVPVEPRLIRTMASRLDDDDKIRPPRSIRDFHVMINNVHCETKAFRNTEPSTAVVHRFVASRRRFTKQQYVRQTMLQCETWPRLILRVKELEHKQSQAAKLKKRLQDMKAKRAAARAKAKAKAKAAA
jgi:hypothetical protein